jgi:hypothetical protein
MLILLAAVWIGSILMIQHRSGLSLLELVLPFRKAKADVYGSFYVLYFAIYIPLAIGAAIYLRAERLQISSAMCFLTSMLVALGTAQRRTVLIVLLFVTALHFFRYDRYASGGRGSRGKLRVGVPTPRPILWVKMACAAAGCLAAGPVLWWARNWFTGIADPVREIVRPWEHKSFFELFFGSAGAGFPTFLLVREWIEAEGVQWGVSLIATICAFIPRELWADKPVSAELLLQEHFGLATMPSTFLLNELYLNAGLLSFPLALLVGRGLSGLYYRCVTIGSLRCRILAAAMFANLITIFKNGLGPFAVNVVFLVVLCWCAMTHEKGKPSVGRDWRFIP